MRDVSFFMAMSFKLRTMDQTRGERCILVFWGAFFVLFSTRKKHPRQ